MGTPKFVYIGLYIESCSFTVPPQTVRPKMTRYMVDSII